MNSFTLRLQDTTHSEELTGIVSFVVEDASGSFGLMAGHARMMTTLSVGMARLRTENGTWRYLALAGSVLYFCENLLTVTTRHYLLDDDYRHVSQALKQQFEKEEKKLHELKYKLHSMEEDLMKRLWTINHSSPV